MESPDPCQYHPLPPLRLASVRPSYFIEAIEDEERWVQKLEACMLAYPGGRALRNYLCVKGTWDGMSADDILTQWCFDRGKS